METIELKLSECVALNREIAGLEKAGVKLPAKTGYWLGRLSARTEAITKAFEHARIELVRKYGTEDGKGNITVKPKNAQSFSEEFSEMEAQVEQINTRKFKIEDFGNAEIPLTFFHAAWMLVEVEDDVPAAAPVNAN